VAPVLEEKMDERTVYLPKGDWIDFWSARRFKGPKTITVEAPLDRLPLYVAARNLQLTAMLKKARLEIFKD
jgi:alpha-glucosidase